MSPDFPSVQKIGDAPSGRSPQPLPSGPSCGKEAIDAGLLGHVHSMEGRASKIIGVGAEDLWVLGTRMFDLFNAFAGKPVTCSAEIKADGKVATKIRSMMATKDLGPCLGMKFMPNGKWQTDGPPLSKVFVEKAHDEAGFGLEIKGSKGSNGHSLRPGTSIHFIDGSVGNERIPLTSSGLGKPEMRDIEGTVRNHLAAIHDLIHCLERGGSPICGLEEGTSTVSFVSSVFESYRQGGKVVGFPLEKQNPSTCEPKLIRSIHRSKALLRTLIK